MMFAMMFFFVWGEDMKVSSLNESTLAVAAKVLHLQNVVWEVTRMSGSTYFRSQLKK
jgi:hypothetical protein